MTFRENTEYQKTPYTGIGIDIIDGCNLRCVQCYYIKGRKPYNKLSLEQVKYIIEKASGKFSELYILGGEPTLHHDIVEILKFGLEKMKLVILVTNGIKLADENFCKKIALPNLMISMHMKSLLPEATQVVNFLAQKKGVFEKHTNAWRNVIKYWEKEHVNVQMNLLKPLVENGYAMDAFRWAREKGFEPIIELTKPGPIFERGNPLDVSLSAIEDIYAEMRKYDLKNYPGLKINFDPIVPPNYGHRCTMIETGIHVAVDGTIIPCVAHSTIPLGNIFTDDLDSIMESEIRKSIQDFSKWIVGPCRTCKYFEFCHGGCRGEAIYDTGCPRASDPYCWHIPKGLTLRDMVPVSCKGCILEDNQGCSIKV